ncbi:HD domain-containing protein [Chloroflexota bacterium]
MVCPRNVQGRRWVCTHYCVLSRENVAVSNMLLELIRVEFALRLDGIHGIAHWARVCENGLRLAERTGGDPEVVELFAYLHDSQRLNDGWDLEHGHRAAEFVRRLQGWHLDLSAENLELLATACAHHSDGLIEADVTIQTCWDADRLDLGRIGIEPDPRYLCTFAAKDAVMIEWAVRRSQRVP